MKFWIKERHNPQTGIYYVACGQLKVADAKRAERSLYGHNVMHAFPTQAAYDQRLAELRASGKRVQ